MVEATEMLVVVSGVTICGEDERTNIVAAAVEFETTFELIWLDVMKGVVVVEAGTCCKVTMVGVTWAVGALVVWIAIGRILAVGVVVTVGFTAAVGAVDWEVGREDEPSEIGTTALCRGLLSFSICWSLDMVISCFLVSAACFSRSCFNSC